MYCFFLSYYLLFVVLLKIRQKFNLITSLFVLFVENGEIRLVTIKRPRRSGVWFSYVQLDAI